MNFLIVHFWSLIITIPAILYADHLGFLYFTGKIQTISHKKVQYTHWFVTIGLFLLIASGIIITIPAWALFFENPFFYIKIALVVSLFLNGIFIGQVMKKATQMPFAQLPLDEKRFLFISGIISLCGWCGTILIGFFGL